MTPRQIHLGGLGLFLFIPVVLYLFVRHPEPVGASLAAGVVLMLGHRFVAAPWAARVRDRRCLWCARVLADGAPRASFDVRSGAATVGFVACPDHEPPARRFLDWVDRCRLPLRLGIGLPLVALLVALFAAAFGRSDFAPVATETFRLVVGLTVHLAALGPRLGRPDTLPRAAFPLHNFSLLGVRALLWIFRIVGIWWIVGGALGLWRLLS